MDDTWPAENARAGTLDISPVAGIEQASDVTGRRAKEQAPSAILAERHDIAQPGAVVGSKCRTKLQQERAPELASCVGIGTADADDGAAGFGQRWIWRVCSGRDVVLWGRCGRRDETEVDWPG